MMVGVGVCFTLFIILFALAFLEIGRRTKAMEDRLAGALSQLADVIDARVQVRLGRFERDLWTRTFDRGSAFQNPPEVHQALDWEDDARQRQVEDTNPCGEIDPPVREGRLPPTAWARIFEDDS